MKQLIMTTPVNYQVDYEINPFMQGNVGQVNLVRALQQWNELRNALLAAGADVIVMNEAAPEQYPDATFISNAGLLYQDEFYLAKPRHAERQVEMPYFGKWFNRSKFNVEYSASPGYFEGAGDAIFSHDRKHLWYGIGLRSTFNFKRQLDEWFDKHEQVIVRPLVIVDARFTHLDEVFCPLDTGELLWYPDAFDQHSQSLIESWYKHRIVVSEQDALRLAVNAISIDDTIIVPHVSVSLSTSMKSRGYTVSEVNMSEFILAGGACKSLTLEVI